MINSRPISWTLCFLVLAGCTNMCSKSRLDLTPEEVVQSYLDISLSMSSIDDKARLLNLTTGNLRNAIEQASDETLNQAFVSKRFHLEAYSVVERRDRTPRETEITFVLTYRDMTNHPESSPDEAPQVTTENTVAVIKYKGAWAIRDVLGKTTSLDFPTSKGAVIKPENK